MSITYVGDCSFKEMPQSGSIEIDPWGMDKLTRVWSGKNSDLDTFLDNIGQGGIEVVYSQNPVAGVTAILDRSRTIADSLYPQMFAVSFSIDIARAFAVVTANYRGVSTGKLPPPVPSFGYRTQSVTLEYGIDGSGITATFQYNAPYSTYTYVTRKQPRKAIYKSKLEYLQDSIQIVSRTGAGGVVKYFVGPSVTNKSGNTQNINNGGTAGHYNAVVEVIGTLDAQPDGQWWNVVETNEMILTPLNLSNDGWAYQLGLA